MNCAVCGSDNVKVVFGALNRGHRGACLCERCSGNKSFTPVNFDKIHGKIAKHGLTAQAQFKVVCNDANIARYEFTKLDCKWIAVNKTTAVVITPIYARFNKLSCVRELIGILENNGIVKRTENETVEFCNMHGETVTSDLLTAILDAKYIKF